MKEEKENAKVKPPISGVDSFKSDRVRYKMNHGKRGIAVIISNRLFTWKMMKPRRGTEKDVESMNTTLTALGFEVEVLLDLTANRLKKCLESKAKLDHTDHDCFVCVIMTHGSEESVSGTDGEMVSLKELISCFVGQSCPSLAGKPKIFITNACQGEKLDEGHDLYQFSMLGAASDSDDDQEGDNFYQNLPYELDFLYIHSTVPGYVSYRNVTGGSFFIQTLCDVITKYGGDVEICKLLAVVNRKVAVEFISNVENTTSPFHAKKQCPCFLSLLTKQLYLGQK